ncbi:MAG: hypothetical protein VB934_02620 [Polyangiaceae bacterium]
MRITRTLSGLAMLLVALCAGCADTISMTGPQSGGGEGGGDGLSARQFYLDQVHPELVQSCAICHKSSADCTPKLMAVDGETSYDTLKSLPGMVTHPDNSNLIHHGAHTGPTLTLTQETLTREWLSREFPTKPIKRTQVQALALLGSCMEFDDFMDTGVYKFAYQQTQFGPCGACHKTGEAGAWIGYNPEEMFAKNTRLPWIKRLVHPVYDKDKEFIEFRPSNRFIDKPELSNQCGSAHPSALIPAKLEQSLVDFLAVSMVHYDAEKCATPADETAP